MTTEELNTLGYQCLYGGLDATLVSKAVAELRTLRDENAKLKAQLADAGVTSEPES